MKKITLLCFLLLTFFSQSYAQFIENFDTNTSLPVGWSIINQGGANEWLIANIGTGAHSGTNVARITYNSTAHDDYLITPAIVITSGVNDRISFYIKSLNSGYLEPYEVVLSTTTNTAGSDFSITLQSSQEASANWEKKEFNLAAYAGQTVYIAVRATGTDEDRLAVDDFVNDAIPSCPQPTALTANSVVSNAAELTWTENGTASLYNVEIVPSGTPATGTATDSGVTNPFNKTGLTPSTSYDYYVQADCGGGDLSLWSGPFTFTTACTAVDSFTENFDGVSTPDLPACWSKILDNGASSYAYIETSTSADYSAPNGVTLYNSDSSNGANIILVSPLLSNLSDGTHQLHFFASASDASQDIEVGTISNTANGAAFTPLTTVDLSTTYTEYVVPFDTYFGLDSYVAIRRVSTTTYTYVYLDNISWEPIPSCPSPLLSSLNVTHLTSSSADLVWVENGSATTWNIEWGATGFTPGSGTMITGSTTNPHSLTGLTPSTSYDFYVQADCGSDTSSWVGPFTFTTSCTAYTIPYFEGFESGYTQDDSVSGCLTQESINGTQTWSANTSSTNYNRTPRTGSWNAYLRYSNEDWIFIPVELVGGTSYTVNLFARQDGSTASDADISISYGNYGTDTDMTNTIVTATGIINGVYQEITGSFTPATSGTYYVGIKGYMNGNPWYISLDDISIYETPSCPAPYLNTLYATNITSASADLGWVESGSATTWNIEWGTTGFTPGTGNVITGTTTNPHNLTSLSATTTYDFYVQTDCGGGDLSSWTGPYTFTTACAAVDSFNENFDAVSTPDLPACWSKVLDNGVSSYAYVETSTSADFSAPNGVTLYNSDSPSSANIILISPIVSNLADGTHQLRFYASASSASQDIEVGTITDVLDGSTFTPLTTVDLSSTYTEYIVPFDTYFGLDNYIAIRRISTSTYTYVYLDNIAWEPIPSCPAPLLSSLNVTNLTTTSADLGWTESGSAATWNIEWGVAGFTPGTGTLVTGTTTNPHNLTGLTPSTSYEFYVQADCGGDTSVWIGPYSFYTGHCIPSGTSPDSYIDSFTTTNGAVNINNLTSGFSATNYGNMYNSMTVSQGQNGTVDFSVEIVGGSVGCAIWVDWNNDLLFQTSEVAYSTTGYGYGPFTGTITVPSGVANGDYRMRVMVDYNDSNPGDDNACSFSSGRGEVEDYKFTVDSALSATQFDNTNFAAYPNPVKDILNLSYSSPISKVQIINLLGQVVISKNIDNTTTQIDMSDLNSGAYIVNISINDTIKSIKVIKQ
ncbi:T9SS-dependent choice-of-anchor J family protein [Flavobacterium sp. J27]|uniref:T9SS-dependent choice-of-anchor J family protein n=1 Tax=Flavobacterium sp. J27 TaxID=2060419 RepID=UPI001030BB00|nr:choice-of-anchor J domain-containing protein [Flavobacterium sp. J27]